MHPCAVDASTPRGTLPGAVIHEVVASRDCLVTALGLLPGADDRRLWRSQMQLILCRSAALVALYRS
jgi:hypothetical protein